jgi:hypothetical protein
MSRGILSACLFLLAIVPLAGCGSKAKVGDPPKTGAGSPSASEDREKLMKAVEEGDALWDAGEQGVKEAKKNKNLSPIQARKKFDEAFEKYMVVVNSQQGLPDRNVLSKVYGRVIDVALERKNNPALAKEVAIKSLRQDVLPTTNSDKASAVLEAAKRAVKAEDK